MEIFFHLCFLLLFLYLPSSTILNETDRGYVTSRNQKLNHLLFLDDLKLYEKSVRDLYSLVQLVRIFLMMLVWYLV